MCGELERQLVRVYRVEATIGEHNLDATHGEATQHTVLHRILEALLYGRNELLGHVTTLHLVDELYVALSVVFVLRTYGNDDVGKLTATTTLLLVNLTPAFNGLRDGLLIVNLGLTLVTLYLELALQTVDNDIEVKLTHT